jgi:hypothetical protein
MSLGDFFKNLGQTWFYGKSDERYNDELQMAKNKFKTELEMKRAESELQLSVRDKAFMIQKKEAKIYNEYMKNGALIIGVIFAGIVLIQLV